jgi:hypothetical protein
MEQMFRSQRIDTLEKRIGWYKEQIEQLKAKLDAERVAEQQECYPWEGLDGPINTMGLGERMTNALNRMCWGRRGGPAQPATVRSLLAFDWDDPFIMVYDGVGEKTVAAVKLWKENNKDKEESK